MAKLGVFRSQTQASPSTAPAFSSPAIVRRMSTANRPIKESNTTVIDISGYTTVHGYAAQGRTPAPGSGQVSSHASQGNTKTKILAPIFKGAIKTGIGH